MKQFITLVVGFLILHLGFTNGQKCTPPQASELVSCDPNDIGFYLFPNQNDWNDKDELKFGDIQSILNSRFNKSNPVLILTHGYTQNLYSVFPQIVKNAYLNASFPSKANIIAIDWAKLSNPKNTTIQTLPSPGITIYEVPFYALSVDNVFIAGQRVADFIAFLIQNNQASGPQNFHLVGQSLGAHVSGMAGYHIKQSLKSSLGRITGTDPAGPLFQLNSIDRRLDSTDADFVDIVHTNQGEFGFVGPLGDVDFFVNGGVFQFSDCGLQNLTDPVCSHNLATNYFAKTINKSPSYFGISCISAKISEVSVICTLFNPVTKQRMGEYCPESAHGLYYINMTLSS